MADDVSNTPARTCLVLGGARSGKSAYAQALAECSRFRPVYLATAAAWDEEMERRVAAHRRARDARWTTVEEQRDLAGVLHREAGPEIFVLVDCLTLWLTNVMLAGADPDRETDRLVMMVRGLAGPAVFVSNEVGSGIVPDHPLGRAFRDAQGRLNQRMAETCDAVVLVTAGLPAQLKPAPRPLLRFA